MAYTDLTSLLKAIANSIRSKTSTTAAINAQDFPSKIDSIKVGITPSGTKSITSNGTYDVTNYASASVNVSSAINGVALYPYVPNTYDSSSIITTLMVPVKLTKLIVSAYQWNAGGSTMSWGVNARIRRAGTSTWDTLDSSTISIGGSSGSTYSKTFTSFNNYKYDAISFTSPDPKRLSNSSVTVTGNT